MPCARSVALSVLLADDGVFVEAVLVLEVELSSAELPFMSTKVSSANISSSEEAVLLFVLAGLSAAASGVAMSKSAAVVVKKKSCERFISSVLQGKPW